MIKKYLGFFALIFVTFFVFILKPNAQTYRGYGVLSGDTWLDSIGNFNNSYNYSYSTTSARNSATGKQYFYNGSNNDFIPNVSAYAIATGIFASMPANFYYDITINFNDYCINNNLDLNGVNIVGGSSNFNWDFTALSLITFENNSNVLRFRVYANSSVSALYITLQNSNQLYPITKSDRYFSISSIDITVANTTNNTEIMNNATNNASNIISNQNQNTQNIIENQNNLLGDKCNNLISVNSSNKTINGITFTNNGDGTITANGTATADASYNIYTNNLSLSSGTYILSGCPRGGSSSTYYMANNIQGASTYDYGNGVSINVPSDVSNKSIWLIVKSGQSVNNLTFKPQLEKGNSITAFCPFGSSSSKIDNTNKAINNLNDSINNSNVDSANSSISGMEAMLPTNSVITDLITLPLTLYQKIVANINGTCASFSLGSLYDTELIMPCIDISSYLGITLWGTIDLIISGVFVLVIARKMIKAFNSFTFMKEGDVING